MRAASADVARLRARTYTRTATSVVTEPQTSAAAKEVVAEAPKPPMPPLAASAPSTEADSGEAETVGVGSARVTGVLASVCVGVPLCALAALDAPVAH